MSAICTDPKGHLFIINASAQSECASCGRIEKYDKATDSVIVIKE